MIDIERFASYPNDPQNQDDPLECSDCGDFILDDQCICDNERALFWKQEYDKLVEEYFDLKKEQGK